MRITRFILPALALLAVLYSLQSCYYDVEETLYPGEACDPANFAYSTRIRPLIETHCLPCHSPSLARGNVVLEGYTNARDAAVDGNFICSIEHTGNCSPMPDNAPKLSDCDINAVKAWVDGGAPEN